MIVMLPKRELPACWNAERGYLVVEFEGFRFQVINAVVQGKAPTSKVGMLKDGGGETAIRWSIIDFFPRSQIDEFSGAHYVIPSRATTSLDLFERENSRRSIKLDSFPLKTGMSV
jgi:hypothetical protein